MAVHGEEKEVYFEGETTIEAPSEKVWGYISDPRNGVEYIPKVKKLEVISETDFNATVGVIMGGIIGNFELRFQIAENTPLGHAKIKAAGRGIKSTVQFESDIDLSDTTEGKTLMKWKADVGVGGLIAGVGQRLLRMAANKMTKEIFERLKSNMESQIPPVKPAD
ncbi:MAG: SRPBCC domain-containing protein [Syntrophobacteraceae bacterium]|jgi:carbon monoxide dehydrogenase subunit G